MISNLPLLFAEGYPTCLEKFTLAQLEKFVPFMLQCSLGEIHVDKYTPPPKWWPNELPFANTVEKPSGMDESRWFSMLKSMVCKCYTHHECEFMLRFCTELSDCPSTSYMFVESWDGTTSLYNKENGRLMVTFRNENREYDKVVETSPRRSLLPKGSTQNAARRLVPPPAFDIYLCDNCDGEFNSLREVQEHERTCNKQLEDHDQDQDQDQDGAGQYFCSEEPPEQPCQENFLNYFRLYPTNGEIQPERNSPIKQTNCRRRYPAGVTFTRCCSVPFSSPLGVFIQQKSKMAAVKHQVLIDRLERHCVTKLGGLAARYRERDGEFKVQEDIAWPITWKAPHPKKSLDNWTHYYCFTQKERLERLATQLSGGLNLRSRRLLSLCKEVRILLWRMSEEEIKFYTTRRPVPPETNPGECQTFQFPTLLPNTMYTYRTNVNCRTGYAQSIEILENPTMSMSPDPTIPLIDLCSTDEEDEDVKSPVPLSVVPCPEGTDDEDNDGYCYDPTHRRIEEDEQDYSFSDSSTYSYVDVENASFENSAMDYTNAFSSVPQDWQMKVCINSQPSPPASSSASEEDDDGEEEVQEIVSVEPTNFNFVNVDSKVTSFPRNQRKGSVHLGGYNRSQTEHLHVFEHEMEDKIYSPVLHDSPINNAKSHRVQDKHNMQENMQLSMSSCESATVSRNDTRRRSSAVSGVPLSKGKNLLQNRDINSVSITSSKSADICDVMEIIEIPKSNRSKLPTLCQRREQAAKLLGTTCIQNKNDSSLTPLFVNVDNVGLHDDALNHSVTDPAGLGGRVRLSRKLMNTVSPVPTMPKLTRGPSNAISSSRSTLSRERSGILTPLPLPPPLKPAFVQSGSGIPFNFNSFHDLNSHRQNEIQVLRRGCKRQLPNDEPSDEEVEIIVDDNDDDNEPVRKKPCVEEYGAMVSTVDASTQDTSNNDVFGMSVKHEKATESHERCLATSKFPTSVLRLRQDECRKLKRRGLCYVSCKGGRQSKENDCCLDHFGNVTIKKEPGIGGSVPRLGKRVIVTLLDNEVELICSNSAETGLCSIEKKELITSSDCKYEMELKFSRLNNINCSGPKKKECTDQKVTIAAPSTHTCPLVKAEDCHSMEQKFSSDSWKYSDYSSPMMMMSSMMLSVNPEQTLKHSEKSNSEIGPMKVEAKCLREDAKRFKHLDIDFSIKSNLKLDKNGFRVGKKKNNVISSNNLFRSNGQHCFRRKAIDSEEKYSRNLSSSKECKSRCKGDKEIESHKHIKRQNRSKCSSRNSENCTETYRRSLRRCHLNMKNHICKIQCKKH